MYSLVRFARYIVCLLIFAIVSFASEELLEFPDYEFIGRHFIASYYDCDPEALADLKGIVAAMQEGVVKTGAKVLNTSHYEFEPNGLTVVMLLSESHASIHTYPEKNACFIDLFTCGTTCIAENFHEQLNQFLKPLNTKTMVFKRD